jgi:hypothetical protein
VTVPESELAESIRRYAASHPELLVLDAKSADQLTKTIARAHVRDQLRLWWWESLREPAATESYGSADGLARVQQLLGEKPGPFTLMVTDDERPPWMGVRGPLESLVSLLRDQHYFEYLLVDDSLTWVLFDTHENNLVVAGSLTNKLRTAASA